MCKVSIEEEDLLELTHTNVLLHDTNELLAKQNQQKDIEIQRLQQMLMNMQRARFGQSSERRVYVLDDGTKQLSLFDSPKADEAQPVLPVEPVLSKIPVAQHSRKKKRTLAEYWSWQNTIQSPSGKLKDAVVYAHNQKEVLRAFLSHGEMEISNNQVENAIRPFVVGRKGWLFSDTPVAQRQARSSIH